MITCVIYRAVYVACCSTNKKIPKGPPSPPAPVMHSPNRKVTVKEQQEWKIPPCISNWKNAKVEIHVIFAGNSRTKKLFVVTVMVAACLC